MANKGYWRSIEYIAQNDDAVEMDAEAIASQITVHMVAYQFDKTEEQVANDILSIRSGRYLVRMVRAIEKRGK